eukprot:GSMAST32.ASY1.ANO1.517.1 assembled CDS
MPGASWRNVERRREHRERAQPHGRKKLGLLEKHKDYVKRAKDFSKKRKRLNALKDKAAFRNPDEFYFAMKNSRTKNGVHEISRRGEGASMTADMQKLLKTQDLMYASMTEVKEKRRVEKLKANLHFLSEKSRGQHTIFLDKKKDVKSLETLRTSLVDAPLETDLKALSKIKKKRDKAYSELGQRIKRVEKMDLLRQHLQSHKDRQGKGRRKKVKDAEGDKPAVYKWKRQRKR